MQLMSVSTQRALQRGTDERCGDDPAMQLMPPATQRALQRGTDERCSVRGELWDLAPRRQQGAGMRPLRFRKRLVELIEREGIAEIAFEQVARHTGTIAAQVYGELRGTLMAVCEELGVPYRGIPVGTIKRHATGRGGAGKDRVAAAMQARFPGVRLLSDDVSDALAILACMIDGVDL